MTRNELVYAVAEKAKHLANSTLPQLRYAAGNADTFGGAQRENKHKDRGELVEELLTEEFILEFDKGIEE